MMKVIGLVLLIISFGEPSSTSGWVDITEYGADGSDTDPDDVAIEQATKVAVARNVRLYFPAGTYFITRTIRLNYHNQNVGITGDGMHATTIKVDEVNWNRSDKVAIYSRTCAATFSDFSLTGIRTIKLSGILFDFYGGHGNHSNIKVNHFNGFGTKYVAVWDAYVENLIVEDCGNRQEWAFSVSGGHDTSNHTTFNRLQVELPHDKAMYVAPNSLNLVFIGIHSERLIRDASTKNEVSHQLQGGSCSYINARIENHNSVSKILLGNSMGSYTDFRCGGQSVEVSYETRTSQRISNLICESLTIPTRNLSQILLESASVNGTVIIEDQVENHPIFRDCIFRGAIQHTGKSSRAVFTDCNITDPSSLAQTEGTCIVNSSLDR